MIWYFLTVLVPLLFIAGYQFKHKREHDRQLAVYKEWKAKPKDQWGYAKDGSRERNPGEWRWQWKYGSYDSPTAIPIFALVVSAIVFFSIGSLISAFGPLHRVDSGTWSMVSINDGSKTEGAYYLFSGYRDESQIYSFYSKNGDGGYQRSWQYAAYSTIYQDSAPGQANLHQYYLVPNKWIGFTWQPHLRNEFHVPAGTIREDLTLDNVN